MSENYSLIKDEEETKRFIEKVLQPLNNDEVYIVVLTARKKYCPTISSSMEVVSRDIIRNNDPNKILRKLKKMSIVEGLYTDKNDDIIGKDDLVFSDGENKGSSADVFWIVEGCDVGAFTDEQVR